MDSQSRREPVHTIPASASLNRQTFPFNMHMAAGRPAQAFVRSMANPVENAASPGEVVRNVSLCGASQAASNFACSYLGCLHIPSAMASRDQANQC